MRRSVSRRLLLAALAAGASQIGAGAVRRQPPGGRERWQRANYRQRTVDLYAGPGTAAGLLVATVVARAPSAALVTGAAAALGAYDDLAGHTHARGLRGHAAALRDGVVTSGLVKMVGLTAAAVVGGPSRPRRPMTVVVDTVLVAGSANLVNLLDLRPGRALKVAAAVGLPLTIAHGRSGDAAAGLVGVCLARIPDDLGERQMLGDCGANALGAALGWSLAAHLRGFSRAVAAAVIVGLNVTSERVSFSTLIDRTPALAAVDGWGRRTS